MMNQSGSDIMQVVERDGTAGFIGNLGHKFCLKGAPTQD